MSNLTLAQRPDLGLKHLEAGGFGTLRGDDRRVEAPFEPQSVDQRDEVAGEGRSVDVPAARSGDGGDVFRQLGSIGIVELAVSGLEAWIDRDLAPQRQPDQQV